MSKNDTRISCPKCGKPSAVTVGPSIKSYFDPSFGCGKCGYYGKLSWHRKDSK